MAAEKSLSSQQFTAVATPANKGKAELTVSGPGGVTMSEKGSRAAKATHVVVRESREGTEGHEYWVGRLGHPYGYSTHSSPDAALNQHNKNRTKDAAYTKNSWVIPVEHQD